MTKKIGSPRQLTFRLKILGASLDNVHLLHLRLLDTTSIDCYWRAVQCWLLTRCISFMSLFWSVTMNVSMTGPTAWKERHLVDWWGTIRETDPLTPVLHANSEKFQQNQGTNTTPIFAPTLSLFSAAVQLSHLEVQHVPDQVCDGIYSLRLQPVHVIHQPHILGFLGTQGIPIFLKCQINLRHFYNITFLELQDQAALFSVLL